MSINKSVLDLHLSGTEIHGIRPEPIVSEIKVFPFNKRMDVNMAVEVLLEGNYVLIIDFYSTGLSVLNHLKQCLNNKYKEQSFKGQRDFRSVFHELSNRILISIHHHKIKVKKAPEIGWLKMFYPEFADFLLGFPQVQGLNSSWQWFEKGINTPVLNEKIHPFYGTYFPTRFEHLILFDNWLKTYNGEKISAIDIGIGSGILSLQLLKHGFGKIYGTDSNPNAIIGLNEMIKNKNIKPDIELFYGDLFADCKNKTELIVFNPPWLPAAYKSEGIDNAIYYDEDLFPRFFANAFENLNKDGRIVLLFSNLAQISNLENIHPITAELAKENRYEKVQFIQSKVGLASENTKRNQNWRKAEMVELWVLKVKTQNN